MKRLLALIVLISVAEGANWEGAEWHECRGTNFSGEVLGVPSIKCSGDTVYFVTSYGMLRWTPDDSIEAIPQPQNIRYAHFIGHADAGRRYPGVIVGDVLWRLSDVGWDSLLLLDRHFGWTHSFAYDAEGALYYLTDDSLIAPNEVGLHRRGGGQADIDTTLTSCLEEVYPGSWLGVSDAGVVTCAILGNEIEPISPDPINCMRAYQFRPDGVVVSNSEWYSLRRHFLQGIDGRWIVVRGSDIFQADLTSEIYTGEAVESALVMNGGRRVSVVQNSADSTFETGVLYGQGSLHCEFYTEPSANEWWEMYHYVDIPINNWVNPPTDILFFYMIDMQGYGNVFVSDSTRIRRYGPPPRTTSVLPRRELPQELSLSIYPNPGNAEFRLSYSLARSGDVSLMLYDVTGREVATLVDGIRNAGEHVINWSAGAQPSGVYFAVLNAGDASTVTKLVLMK